MLFPCTAVSHWQEVHMVELYVTRFPRLKKNNRGFLYFVVLNLCLPFSCMDAFHAALYVWNSLPARYRYTKTYMPYLTLWNIISQNLAHLEANSYKIFKSHRIFRTSYNTFYEEINIHHTLLCLSQTSYIIKGLLTILLELQSDFCKNLTEFYQISLKNLPHLTDFSPQLMACMQRSEG